MILRIAMPLLGPAAGSSRMERWHKREGEPISYGDIVCDVVVEKAKMLGVSVLASDLLGGTAERRPPSADPGTTPSRTANYVVGVVSSDLGYLRRIAVQAGDDVSAGQTLAIVTTDEAEDVPTQVEGTWTEFRVIWDYAGGSLG